jgi:hypothetical protein
MFDSRTDPDSVLYDSKAHAKGVMVASGTHPSITGKRPFSLIFYGDADMKRMPLFPWHSLEPNHEH